MSRRIRRNKCAASDKRGMACRAKLEGPQCDAVRKWLPACRDALPPRTASESYNQRSPRSQATSSRSVFSSRFSHWSTSPKRSLRQHAFPPFSRSWHRAASMAVAFSTAYTSHVAPVLPKLPKNLRCSHVQSTPWTSAARLSSKLSSSKGSVSGTTCLSFSAKGCLCPKRSTYEDSRPKGE